MPYGKTIELFLADGDAGGLITAELSNWNGKAFKMPRNTVKDCTRPDITEAGVYFLFCQSEDGQDSVYIGEAENIQKRLVQHLNDYRSGTESYYWNTAVFFTGRGLNKAHIRFLEDRLVKKARECRHYSVLTRVTYSDTVLRESEVAMLQEFCDNIGILINALGYKVLVPPPVATPTTQYLYCKGNSGQAKGFLSSGGLTIMRESKVSDHTTPSMESHGRGYYLLRKRLETEGVIADGVFAADYEFVSPSAASSVILGRTSNGLVDWKDENGVPLKSL